MNQKGLVPILIVLILAALVGGYLVYQQSISKLTLSPQPTTQPSPSPTEETANWKTYTNTKYGYSFKHPENASLHIEVENIPSEEIPDQASTNRIAVWDKPFGTKDNRKLFQVVVVNEKRNLEEYKKSLSSNSNRNIKIIKVNNTDALSYEVFDPSYPQAQPELLTAIIGNNIRYDIFLGRKGDNNIANQILSTFRFD